MPETASISSDAPSIPAIAAVATASSPIADGRPKSLDPAWPRADAVSWWITVAFVVAAGLITIPIVWLGARPAGWLMLMIGGGWLILVALLVWGAARWPMLAYRYTSYCVAPHGIEIRRGVLWRRVINVPRSRVQHSDVMQGPILRRYNLAILSIHTAGTENATVTLQGLSHPTAMKLREYLILPEGEHSEANDDVV